MSNSATKNITYCVSSQLDLFQGPSQQISQESNRYVAHYPITSLTSGGPLEFQVEPSQMYTDLSDTRLFIRARLLQGDGQPIAADAPVAPVNMLFHALFRKVDVFLGGRLITQSTDTYPWKAAIETLLNFGKDAKESQLHTIFYHKDSVGNASGLERRQRLTRESRPFELCGPLHVDLFFQDRYLLSEVPLRIVLTRSTPAFYLHSQTPDPNFKIQIDTAILFVRRVKLSPTIELAHAKALEKTNAIYPLHKSEIEVVPLPAGTRVMTRDNLFGGKVPKKLVLAVAASSSLNGSYSDTPFRFVNAGIYRIDLTVDGEPVGDTPLSCDFEKNLYQRAYQSIFRAANKSYADFGTDITYADYKDLYALFCFDLTSDSCGNTTSHFEFDRRGQLRISVGLAESARTLYFLVYGEFESSVEVTNSRDVLVL